MVMGVYSTAPSKRAFCPFSSSPFLSFASSKPMKRREVRIIQSGYSTFPNSTVLSGFPQFYQSCYHEGKSPAQKQYYKLMADTSPAKMIPCYRDQNSFGGKPFTEEIFNQPKLEKRRDQVSRNCSSASVQVFGRNSPQRPHIFATATFLEKNMLRTLTWDEETKKLKKTKAEVFAQINNECLQDGRLDLRIQGVMDSRQSYSQNHELLDKSSIQEQADVEIGIGNDLYLKNLASPSPACTEPKGTGKNNKALDHVNHPTIDHAGKESFKIGIGSDLYLKNLAAPSPACTEPKGTGKNSKALDHVNHPTIDGAREESLEIGIGNDLYLKNLAAPSPACTEPKGTGKKNKALDHVNHLTIDGARKESLYSKVPLEKETYVKPPVPRNLHESARKESLYSKVPLEKETYVKPPVPHNLHKIYNDVLVVDNISTAKEVVKMLTNQYRDLVHACDTEVARIDVKQETPVDHGEVICFSIYSGPEADFGNGNSCLWIDVLDGGRDLLLEFAPFFEDPSIKKVWHNYSFDKHVVENYGFKVSGFHADTMHMARLWDSSRRTEGGYGLEALTSDKKVMSRASSYHEKDLFGKVSMKTIFGKKKVKKDGSAGKVITIPPVEELQREERKSWICYSALDAISTLKLYESLRKKLEELPWKLDGKQIPKQSMFDFYQKYWQPFGEILVKMETEGMLVDRAYLAEIEKVAKAEQEDAVNRFRNWAIKYCPDAKYMNVGSDTQLRQLLFGGTSNSKNPDESLPREKIFNILNTEKVIVEGKKTPTKFRNIKLHSIGVDLPTEKFTATGWPSVGGDALKTLAQNISAEYDFVDESNDLPLDDNAENVAETIGDQESKANHTNGTSTKTFNTKQEAKEACHAIASLCEICSIDSLISNFILPLQGSNVSGKSGRVHCSLNINTETGRLSARRPNLQNQPALEKDRYKIRQAFIAAPGNSLIVADYGQLELRILAHLADCKSMLDAFKAGGDFHSRTAMNMYPHIRNAIEMEQVLLEWHPQPGEDKPPVPLLKDAFASERRKAKMLNFSIAYGKTPVGLARDWKVTVEEAKETVDLWYNERKEVLTWQEARKKEARFTGCVHTLLGRARRFPSFKSITRSQRNHIERAAINTPVQGSAADVAMCAMLEISMNARLKELGWRLLLQVHDEVILEGPTESAEVAKAIVVECMCKPFGGKNILRVDLSVDAKCAQNWYSAK